MEVILPVDIIHGGTCKYILQVENESSKNNLPLLKDCNGCEKNHYNTGGRFYKKKGPGDEPGQEDERQGGVKQGK